MKLPETNPSEFLSSQQLPDIFSLFDIIFTLKYFPAWTRVGLLIFIPSIILVSMMVAAYAGVIPIMESVRTKPRTFFILPRLLR